MSNYHFSHISLWYYQKANQALTKDLNKVAFWKYGLLKRAYRYFSEYGYLLN